MDTWHLNIDSSQTWTVTLAVSLSVHLTDTVIITYQSLMSPRAQCLDRMTLSYYLGMTLLQSRYLYYHRPHLTLLYIPHQCIIIYTSSFPGQESGVSCTCPGFQVSNVVRLQQKFHSQSVSEVETSLLKVSCLFCRHSLEHHCRTYINSDIPIGICIEYSTTET